MKSFKVRGIVIREVFVGESDKILTIFAKEHGKMSVRARSARKSKSKFLAGTQLFTYSDFVISTRGKYHYLSQVDIIESFYSIRSDYDRLCHANYFVEMVDKSLMEGMESNNILLLLLKTLQVICSDKIDLNLVARIFEIKFLDYSGYAPEAYVCGSCGKESKNNTAHFSKEGILCNMCMSLSKKFAIVELSEPSIYAIRYILSSSQSSLYTFTVNQHTLKELQQVCKLLVAELGLNLKSASFI